MDTPKDTDNQYPKLLDATIDMNMARASFNTWYVELDEEMRGAVRNKLMYILSSARLMLNAAKIHDDRIKAAKSKPPAPSAPSASGTPGRSRSG